MEESTVVTTERTAARGAGIPFCVMAMLVAVILAAPRPATAMTADGALITNSAAATMYWGSGGDPWWGAAPDGPYASPFFTMSYKATTTVIVSCPLVALQKWATPTSQAAGGTVTFTICVVNNSLAASAWNVILTDQLPDNMAYVTGIAGDTWTTGGTLIGTAPNYAWSTTSAAGVFFNGQPPSGQTNPYFLRWVINPLGPGRSACMTVRATVL